jgi:hypothetical protein
VAKKRTSIDSDKSILFFDLAGSGKWPDLNPQQKSKVKEFCQDNFVECVMECSGNAKKEHFRGDDGIGYFDDIKNCVNASILFFNKIPDMIRRVPYIENVCLKPRLIAFNDRICGEHEGSYTGPNIEEIIPNERELGKVGTLRLIGEEIYNRLPSNMRNKFEPISGEFKGKQGKIFSVYQYVQTYDFEQIRKIHIPPFIY